MYDCSKNFNEQILFPNDDNELCVLVNDTNFVNLKKYRRQSITMYDIEKIVVDIKKALYESIITMTADVRSRFPLDNVIIAMEVICPSF